MTVHQPVLLDEVIQFLAPQPGATVVDGTLGGGGHTRRLLECVGPSGRVIGIDRDPVAIENFRLSMEADDNLILITANYADIPECLAEMGIDSVDESPLR